MDHMIVYGDPLSGNCQKVRIVAERIGVPYRWVEVNVLRQETRTPEFLAMNPAGQVPVVRFGDGRVLAQSNAIMLHLADGSNLIPADAFERALMFQWLFWEQYSHEPAIAVLRYQRFYLRRPEAEIDPALKPKSERVLEVMNGHLAGRRHFVGDTLSLADIALVAYTRWADDAGLDLAHWPEVEGWVRRVEDELGLA